MSSWRWMGATSRRLSVPAQDLPSAVRSTTSSRSPHEARLVLYARDSSSESMRALLATIKVPAGWAGAGGGERGEGHQAGQESSLLGRRRRWQGPRAAAPLPRRLGVGRSGPSQLLATRAVGTRRARSGRWRDSRRRGRRLEQAWAGALMGLERRRRQIDGL